MVVAVWAMHHQLNTFTIGFAPAMETQLHPAPTANVNPTMRDAISARVQPKRQREQTFIVNLAPDLRSCVQCHTDMRSHVCPPATNTQHTQT